MSKLVPFTNSVPLAVVTRSGVQDTLHRGSAVVVDAAGAVLEEVGERDTRAYIRSAAKPIQCIPVITSGAAEAFGLDDADIAIICGSHRGGGEQVRQVRSILRKCGIGEDRLEAGAGIRDNCSGKHAGMLAACKHLGYPLAGYTSPSHPHQQAIIETLRAVCRLADDEIHVGVDGCSAPIHCFSIQKMARGYARMSMPDEHFADPTAGAIRRITAAMAAHPEGHTGEPAYRDVLGDDVRLLTKAGGNGVYCAGVVGRGIGFAMKIEGGDRTPLLPVFTRLMRRVGVFSGEQASEIQRRFWPAVENRRGETVGTIEVLI
ncbi:MAG: asparaginase [Planctomycetota bacterium]